MDGDLFFLQPKHSSMMRELMPAADNALSVARTQNTMTRESGRSSMLEGVLYRL